MACLHYKKIILQDFNFSWGILPLFVTRVRVPSSIDTEIQIYPISKVK